ncbi:MULTISPECIES: acyl-CoA dehydrogenase family protein [Mycolicibacterium]|uniref:Acyl-CoA dehydrogenase n=1 Tax=Mycolicibacterium mageritense TaxID=53462 RepID=A0AAI8XR54_MYCME|nr:acyl-CoA dehydrogenase family protein [Mycolicibacterium mageritense]MBN3456739.1 acyl-CoA/acyl-ACP dehydrogenase [Mycobacterium sp. DSM 3803]OKH66568.1 acyl-CoA dehydrogenase [Mycobacterium sp. SWH-M3]TXI62663.1 MAG: acyl-CoA dehydrogenase [Mycolicibacterium mageritense]BDY31603.1 hypothetical protein hbim_05559 [Mycolicibacterium mageritense]GJJ20588.1 nrtC protein [Mycolicibacterium mageritense]
MTAVVAADIRAALDEVGRSVADRAAALDAGRTDVRPDLAALGRAGLFEPGFGADLTDMVYVIDEISTHSLAVGFSAWAHRMVLHFLHHAEPSADEDVSALIRGERIGVTAMAAALKHLAGLARLPVVADPQPDGLVLTGPIHWASNVFDDALIVVPARTAAGDTVVAAIDADAAGVTINPPPELMALGATASTSLRLDGVRARRVLHTDLATFVARIRPTFLLLQTAFCAGIARAALAGAADARGGLNTQFEGHFADLSDRAGRLRRTLYRAAADPTDVVVGELIRLRLDTATLAVEATRLESTMAGGAGYVVGSAVNRRLREASFLPIQAPSEGQLRWELTRYE